MFDPTPRIEPARSSPHLLRLSVACVYRFGNAATVQRLLDGVPDDADVRLWALDHVHDALAERTVGQGPGLRSPLLNTLVEPIPHDDRWIVIADDDVDFRSGDIPRLVAWAARAGLDVAQPAHVARSAISHRITRRRLLTIAREVGFVEIGPVVAVSPTARPHVFPLPEADGMGLGTEALWSALPERGLRLGIVDVVRVEHQGRGRPREYDQLPGIRLLHERAARFGGLDATRVTHSSWRWPRRAARWEGTPPRVLRSGPVDPPAR